MLTILQCIKEWRDSARKNNQGGILKVTKLCPMCRAPSKYITPSSIFYKHDDPKKEQVVTAYKDSMARIPCRYTHLHSLAHFVFNDRSFRYFQRTKGDSSKKPLCPFGKDCFYQHLNADGTPFVFSDGVDVCMRVSFITEGRITELKKSFRDIQIAQHHLSLLVSPYTRSTIATLSR